MKDNDKIFKVVLSNSAQFKFSRNFDESLLNEKLQIVRALNAGIQLPVLPQYADKLEKDVIRKSIHGTAGIEGNPLSEEEVNEVLNETDTDKLLSDSELEISNLQSAYELLKKTDDKAPNFNFTIDGIKEIHFTITNGFENEYNTPGEYRTRKVTVGNEAHGGIYIPPKIGKDVVRLVHSFVKWINSEEVISLDPIYRAALTHYHIGKIHPFGDGNGRTARLLEASVLKAAGYKYAPEMLSNYYYRNIDEYFILFSSTVHDKKNQDLTQFIDFIINGLIWSLEQIQKQISTWIRILTLKSHFARIRNERSITQRQYDFLSALLSLHPEGYAFAPENLSIDAPFAALYRNLHRRTITRDIAKLAELDYIVLTKDNLYRLNLEFLG